VEQLLPRPESTITCAQSSSTESCPVCFGVRFVAGDNGMQPCVCTIERRICALLPKRYRLAKLADFPARTAKSVAAWLTQPGEGMFITGPAGTGKTHLAAAVVRRSIENRRPSVLFERCAEFYLGVRESYRQGLGSEATELSRMEAPELLIIDDLAAGSLSDFERRCTLEVLDRRLNCARPTIVTSNWNLEAIAEAMDDRIASRLAQFRLFALEGPDRRVPVAEAHA